MREKLLERFSYLYIGELISLVGFIVLIFLLKRVYPQLGIYSLTSFWISFFLLEILLLQGCIYWYEKWKKLRIDKTIVTSSKITKMYKNLKKLNIALIIISFITFIFDFFKWYPSLSLGSFGVTSFIYIFAVLEYINYFHFQLSYDNLSDIRYLLRSKRLKQSCLSKDFDSMV